MEDLIKAVKSLLSDIESMQSKDLTSWFGGFDEYEDDPNYSGVSIEWPNLAISAAELKEQLTAFEGSPAGKVRIEIGDAFVELALALESLDDEEKNPFHPESPEGRAFDGGLCSECYEPQFDSPSGRTCKNGHGGADPMGAVHE